MDGLRWGSQFGGFNCSIVIPCNSNLPDLVMHIGDGTATIRSEFMMGRPLSGSADPAWVKGMQSRLYLPIATQLFSQAPTVYASQACSLSALTVTVSALASASLGPLSSTKIMSYSTRLNLLCLTLHILDRQRRNGGGHFGGNNCLNHCLLFEELLQAVRGKPWK